jgi:hypothetical protein
MVNLGEREKSQGKSQKAKRTATKKARRAGTLAGPNLKSSVGFES